MIAQRLLSQALLALSLGLPPVGLGYAPFPFNAQASQAAPFSHNQPQRVFRDGEIIVKFKAAQTAHAASVHRALGARDQRRAGFARVARLPSGMAVEEALAWYRARPEVEYAEPNWRVRKADTLPNDGLFGNQWWLRNTGQSLNGIAGTAGADLGATQAWDTGTGTASIIVGVVDTGVDYNHPDLATNIWTNAGEVAGNGLDDDGNGYTDDARGWNFANNNNDPMDDDSDGHGTHVAGIIGAVGNNGEGGSGLNWTVRLMPLKFLDANGDGDIADAAEAIRYAAANGARIINASYTDHQGCRVVTASQAEREAIDFARAQGAVVVAAAGNDGCDNDAYPVYPASHPVDNIIAVAASDQNDLFVTSFPSGGGSNHGLRTVHLAAPGRNIFSTIRQALTGSVSHIAGYDFISGTSMAAPMVSGALALLAAHRPALDWKARREAVLKSATVQANMATRVITSGRANAAAALVYDLATATPVTPSHFTASKQSETQVNLTWIDDSSIESDWVVERKSGANGAFAELARFPSTGEVAVSYADTGVSAVEGTRHTYRAKAANANGDSTPTAEVNISTTLTAPSGLVATVTGETTASLVWVDNSQRETSYRLERAAGVGGFGQVASLSAGTTQYEDSGLTKDIEYRYRVRAHNDDTGYSSYSNIATIIAGSGTDDGGGGGVKAGCFIATAAYGSDMHPKVNTLRRFRDRYLLTNAPGRAFVAAYYRVSPPMADYIAQHDGLRALVRGLLKPLVWLADWIVPPAEAAGWVWRDKTDEPEVREVIARFHDGIEEARAREILGEAGAESADLRPTGFFVVPLPEGISADAFMERLRARPEVRYVEPNRKVRKASGER